MKSTDVYKLTRRTLTIWHGDGNGRLVCVSRFNPTDDCDDWMAEAKRILKENGLRYSKRAYDPQ